MATTRPVQPVTPEMEKHVKEVSKTFARAMNDGDVEKLVSMYTHDAMVFAPNRPVATGPKNIRLVYEEMVQMGCKNMKLEHTRIETDTNHLIVSGTYSLDMPMPTGTMMTDRGKYICIHRMTGPNESKLLVDIWNTDIPMEPKPTKN